MGQASGPETAKKANSQRRHPSNANLSKPTPQRFLNTEHSEQKHAKMSVPGTNNSKVRAQAAHRQSPTRPDQPLTRIAGWRSIPMDPSVIVVPLQSGEEVEVPRDELPDDAADITTMLRRELAPVRLWIEFGVR